MLQSQLSSPNTAEITDYDLKYKNKSLKQVETKKLVDCSII